jgi:hypothetical protein
VVRLTRHADVWDVDARTEVLKIPADNPDVRVDGPDGTLCRAMEAAELDQSGAMAALIELKLSDNAQFRDPAGACKLLEIAVARGDQAMSQRLAGRRGP